ncbi:MAG: galactokinase [Erysipelotrichales bacterium]|nr:MAG: galactokinase [Erysipelotrichales bacterium]
MTSEQLLQEIQNQKLDEQLITLYGIENLAKAKQRILMLCERFEAEFDPRADIMLISAPGRTEIGGNHTDHQRGRVLAAAIDRDVLILAATTQTSIARCRSDGFVIQDVDLSDREVHDSEKFTTEALIRGVSARIRALDFITGGFDAVIASTVLTGSGMSSSAAFEVALGTLFNNLYNEGKIPAATIAKIGQAAENIYFKKPCGIMDQMTSAVGGFVGIDFFDPNHAEVQKIDFDFATCGYTLCLVDTGSSHQDLSQEYAEMPRDMKRVAEYFEEEVLSEVDPNRFFEDIAKLRPITGDRAILRAMHFFQETERVVAEIDTLSSGDFQAFLELMIESGRSSYMYNQNVINPKAQEQSLGLALALSESYLKGRGAWRVHGGGLAGTIQVIVKNEDLAGYRQMIEEVFAKGSCHVMRIRSEGAIRIL